MQQEPAGLMLHHGSRHDPRRATSEGGSRQGGMPHLEEGEAAQVAQVVAPPLGQQEIVVSRRQTLRTKGQMQNEPLQAAPLPRSSAWDIHAKGHTMK